MSSSKCSKIEVDFDDDTVLYIAKAASLEYIKHYCSRTFIDEALVKFQKRSHEGDLNQTDIDEIYKAIGVAVFNDFLIDAINELIKKVEE